MRDRGRLKLEEGGNYALQKINDRGGARKGFRGESYSNQGGKRE